MNMRAACIGVALLCAIVATSSCDEDLRRSLPTGMSPNFGQAPTTGGEGEVFGNIYRDSVIDTTDDYWVCIEPADQPTSSRLHGENSGCMFADPDPIYASVGWMYEWTDPDGGGACGGLAAYNAGTMSARDWERHRPGPGDTIPDNTRETHCVRPGTYTFSVWDNPSADGTALKVFDIDYVPSLVAVTDNADPNNATIAIEEHQFDEDDAGAWFDNIVHVEFEPGVYSAAALDMTVQNRGRDPTIASMPFFSTPNVGDTLDYFAFSTSETDPNWVTPNWQKGFGNFRLYWDFPLRLDRRSGYYGSGDETPLARVHRFAFPQVTALDTFQVAVVYMRPFEVADDTSGALTQTLIVGPPMALPDSVRIKGSNQVPRGDTCNWTTQAWGASAAVDFWDWQRLDHGESVWDHVGDSTGLYEVNVGLNDFDLRTVVHYLNTSPDTLMSDVFSVDVGKYATCITYGPQQQ